MGNRALDIIEMGFHEDVNWTGCHECFSDGFDAYGDPCEKCDGYGFLIEHSGWISPTVAMEKLRGMVNGFNPPKRKEPQQ